MPTQGLDDLDYRLDQYSDLERRFVLIAATSSLLLGRAAFAEAARLYPDTALILRQRARIIERYPDPLMIRPIE